MVKLETLYIESGNQAAFYLIKTNGSFQVGVDTCGQKSYHMFVYSHD